MTPEESYSTFELQIELPSALTPGTTYWASVGTAEGTVERALRWLKADFNTFKENPQIVYRVIKITYYKQSLTEVIAPTHRESHTAHCVC